MNLAEVRQLEKYCPPHLGRHLKHVGPIAQRYASMMRLADLIEKEVPSIGFIQIRNALIRQKRHTPDGRFVVEACAMGKVMMLLGIDGSGLTDDDGRIFSALPGVTKDDVGEVIKMNDVDLLTFTQIADRVRRKAAKSELE